MMQRTLCAGRRAIAKSCNVKAATPAWKRSFHTAKPAINQKLSGTTLAASAVAIGLGVAASVLAWDSVRNASFAAEKPPSHDSNSAKQIKKEEKAQDDMIEQKVAHFDDLKDGEMKEVVVGKVKVLLARVDGKYYAIINKCPHFGAPLTKGVLGGVSVGCPWHAAQFDVTTGKHLTGPAIDDIPSFEVRMDGKDVYVKVPANGPEKITFSKKGYHCGCSAAGEKTVVIVGAGAAGLIAAQTIRQDGYKGRVVLINSEDTLPYDRTMLSKQVGIPLEKITMRDDTFFKAHDIEVLRGVAVTEVNTKDKTVTLADGSSIKFDGVLLATGGAPVQPKFPGSELSNVFVLRSAANSKDIADAAASAERKKVVVVGSSFIGLEVAAALKKSKGLDVTIVGMEDVPLQNVLGPVVGEAFRGLHEENGVHFKLGHSLKEITGKGKVDGVLLDNGERIEADLVVMGLGVRPATSYVKGLTKEKDGSLKVDSTLKAADGVYVAGDIAKFPYFLSGQDVRIEHWAVAQDQGRVVGHNLAGNAVEYKQVPFFWTNQYGVGLRYAGHSAGYDDVLIEGDVKGRKFVAYYLKKDKVVAVATMGREGTAIAAVQLLGMKDGMPSGKQLRQGPVDLVQLLHDKTQ